MKRLHAKQKHQYKLWDEQLQEPPGKEIISLLQYESVCLEKVSVQSLYIYIIYKHKESGIRAGANAGLEPTKYFISFFTFFLKQGFSFYWKKLSPGCKTKIYIYLSITLGDESVYQKMRLVPVLRTRLQNRQSLHQFNTQKIENSYYTFYYIKSL